MSAEEPSTPSQSVSEAVIKRDSSPVVDPRQLTVDGLSEVMQEYRERARKRAPLLTGVSIFVGIGLYFSLAPLVGTTWAPWISAATALAGAFAALKADSHRHARELGVDPSILALLRRAYIRLSIQNRLGDNSRDTKSIAAALLEEIAKESPRTPR